MTRHYLNLKVVFNTGTCVEFKRAAYFYVEEDEEFPEEALDGWTRSWLYRMHVENDTVCLNNGVVLDMTKISAVQVTLDEEK